MKFFGSCNMICLFLTSFFFLFFGLHSYAQAPDPSPGNQAPGLMPQSGSSRGSGTALPDLFTGTMSYTIPIEVPPGRKGMDPGLALFYRSSNGNGIVGVGWELEAGAIERSNKFGVDYMGDDYVFRMAGASVDLVNFPPGSNEYRAKIEGGFNRFRKLTAGDGRPYWEVTDKAGTRYLFGYVAGSRQDDPNDASRIFKWCLDQVVDPNGNYMTLYYTKDQGQIYLDRIDYAGYIGHGPINPSNYVKFNLEPRDDSPEMYSRDQFPATYATNFKVKTAYRLRTIEVFSNGQYPWRDFGQKI